LDELIFKSVIEIHKFGFSNDAEDAGTIPWNNIQFWKIIKDLSKEDHVYFIYTLHTCILIIHIYNFVS